MKSVKEKREELKKALSGDKNAIGDDEIRVFYKGEDEGTIMRSDGTYLTPEEVERHNNDPNVIHIRYEPIEDSD